MNQPVLNLEFQFAHFLSPVSKKGVDFSDSLRALPYAESDGGSACAANLESDDTRAWQLNRALQPADTSRRGIRDARRYLRWEVDRGLSGRHSDGCQLLLWAESGNFARQILRGA